MSLFLKSDQTDRYRCPEGFLVQFSFLDRLPIGPVSNRLNQWPGRAGRFFKNQTGQLHHFIFFLEAHISLGPMSTPMMSLLGKIANYIMSPMGRPNNQFTCKGWKDFLEP